MHLSEHYTHEILRFQRQLLLLPFHVLFSISTFILIQHSTFPLYCSLASLINLRWCEETLFVVSNSCDMEMEWDPEWSAGSWRQGKNLFNFSSRNEPLLPDGSRKLPFNFHLLPYFKHKLRLFRSPSSLLGRKADALSVKVEKVLPAATIWKAQGATCVPTWFVPRQNKDP